MKTTKISTAIEKATVTVIKDYDDRPDSYRVTLGGELPHTVDVEAKDKKEALSIVSGMLKNSPILPEGLVFDNGETHQTVE